MRFEGTLMSQIKRFKEFVNQYYSQLEEMREKAEKELSSIPIFKIESKRKWYLDVLDGRRVVGVDGSQITPLRDIGIPVGAVQIAKVIVVHGKGEANVSFYSAFVPMEENVDLRRFQIEIETLMEEMDSNSWLFFDGSLVLSFTAELSKKLREEYIGSINSLLKKSKKTQTPLIGYIDRSYAKDLARNFMLEAIYDSYLLSNRMDAMTYTPAFKCGEIEDVCYAYLRVNPALPIRIEYPSWMKDMHDEVVRVVVAECMLGSTKGYPYILERSHNYSAIGGRDKMSFMKAVGSHGVSFKWMSKLR
jgi:hypothetical protein